MIKPFKELYYPELVKDVQDIYWEHIDPLAGLRENVNRALRGLKIGIQPEFEKIRMLREKYTFLGSHMLVFKIPVNWTTNVHLDGISELGPKPINKMDERVISLNIPIQDCTTDCVTEFYDAGPEYFWKDMMTYTRWLLPDKTPNKICEYRLTTNPVLTNPQVPHRVNNLDGKKIRVSVSWTIDPELSWDYLCNYFDEQGRSL